MTLEDFLRLPASVIDVAHQVNCSEDQQVTLCAIDGQTLAGDEVEMQAHFYSLEPVPRVDLLQIPPDYEISMQEIRMGGREPEERKRQQREETKRRIRAENRERELNRAGAYRLANIVARYNPSANYRILQALTDRYGPPVKYGPPLNLSEWSDRDAKLQFSEGPSLFQINYLYVPLKPAQDAYIERLRRERAADM